MYLIKSRLNPPAGREFIGIADKAGRRYFFKDTTTPHEISEQKLKNLKIAYGKELEKYISIEKIGGNTPKKPVSEPKKAVRTEESSIIDREGPETDEDADADTTSPEELSYREIYREIRQMTLEEIEALHEIELKRDVPRKSVIQEIERAKKRLTA